MRKLGYLIANNANNLTITSRIFFAFDPAFAPPGGWNALNMQAFINYVITDIQGVWNSEYNRGLQPPFSSTPYTVRTNITGVIVAGRPGSLNEGEVFINVLGTNGTSFIAGGPGFLGVRASRFNPNTDFLRTGSFYTGAFDGENRARFNVIGGITSYTPPTDYENTFAHEFGHILGLADRYVSICNVHKDPPPGTPPGAIYTVSNHNPVVYPMYLPGFYDREKKAPEAGGSDRDNIDPDVPRYNQIPYSLGVANPQSNYNKMPYDLDYSVRFGWIHNLMSNPRNSPHNKTNDFLGSNATYEFLYKHSADLNPLLLRIPISPLPLLMAVPPVGNTNLLGSACSPNSEKTIIISRRQIDIIRNKNSVEFIKYGQILQRFIYTKATASNTVKEPSADAMGVTSSAENKFFLNKGSFLGIVLSSYKNNYSSNLGYNPFNLNSELGIAQYGKRDFNDAVIVSDEKHDGESTIINMITNVINVPVVGVPAGATRAFNLCTITTTQSHGLMVGSYIHLFGSLPDGGIYGPVQTILSPTQFVIQTPGIAPPPIVAATDYIVTAGNFKKTAQLLVTNASNTTPIVITTSDNHFLRTSDLVTITGVLGNLNANVSDAPITIITNTTFSIDGSVGSGTYIASANDFCIGKKNTQYLKVGNITGATNTNPIVITANAHGLNGNDLVSIEGVAGNIASNVNYIPVTIIDANTFSLNGINGVTSGVYGGGGLFKKCYVNPGIEDVMDYRMSKFNNKKNKKLWTRDDSDSRVGAEYGFFNIYINNGEFSRADFSPGTAAMNPNFNRNINDLITGDITRFNILCASRLAKTEAHLNSDRLNKIGYFYEGTVLNNGTSIPMNIVWNSLRNLDPIPLPPTPGVLLARARNINPQTPPVEFIDNNDTVFEPLPNPLKSRKIQEDVWDQVGNMKEKWSFNDRVLLYQIYYTRMDIVFIPY